ncbi:MAG TPA: ABC transporter ATP-binding protein [Vicinamibacterales bacterium]|nr:ABC transporter ATP-binding protein [Vicinamibacterales bacterium]
MTREPVKLAVRNVSKSFRVRGPRHGHGRVEHVLGDVSFDVRQGEVVSLIGESGCGKTTLLKIIQGLIRSDGGTILVDGVPVTAPGRDRGFVFQHASLLPWRNALHNVELGLELHGMPRAERIDRARTLLDLVGLGHAADQYPHQLSGGMQQRIGLARALAIDPAILLMDEPFSALDAQTREVLQAELLRIHGETGKTTLFVTHDLDEAIYLSDRVVVLAAKPGRVRQVIDIPFAYPRPELPELRGSPVFQQVRTTIWSLIRSSSDTPHAAKQGRAAHAAARR